jgi:hypothetical protein
MPVTFYWFIDVLCMAFKCKGAVKLKVYHNGFISVKCKFSSRRSLGRFLRLFLNRARAEFLTALLMYKRSPVFWDRASVGLVPTYTDVAMILGPVKIMYLKAL